jgi:pheromone a factor receptor
LIQLPTQLYFFYGNIVFPKIRYSWKLIHEPSAWNQIGLIPGGGHALIDRWILSASAFLVFIFFGLGRDATEMYRGWLLAIGLGRIFPSLHEPRYRRHPNLSGSTAQGSLGSHGSRAKLFFPGKGSKVFSIASATTSS